MSKYWYHFLAICLSVPEVTQIVWLIIETNAINSKYANFMKNNLDMSANNTNLVNRYPYYLTEQNYLCRKNFTISLSALQTTGKFSDAQQIRDYFANHSEKWRNFYLWTYWGI